ncbi:uncharacterized protein LOC132057561 [Lycium ferocissimum]|uniref:uncharacterized protein LOC132057561 n=1 Tax=Lycium ferocissimum TaxID=112874 RepID=UPI002816021B|nr:uncharacterized protein LOC132057561 [Lycium ferocissimum]
MEGGYKTMTELAEQPSDTLTDNLILIYHIRVAELLIAFQEWSQMKTKSCSPENLKRKKSKVQFSVSARIVQRGPDGYGGKKWCPGNSQAWKQLLKAREKCDRKITWKIINGSFNFWWDDWTKQGPLALICPNQDGSDYAIWKDYKDGHYNNHSAWQLVRRHKPKNLLLNSIWSNSIPFKFSFLSCRLYHIKLPFLENMPWVDNRRDINCLCCRIPTLDFMHHRFVEGQAAQNIWKKIGAPLGMVYQYQSIRNIYTSWWINNPINKVHKLVIQVCLVIICWQLWKEWTACKHGDQKKYSEYNLEIQYIGEVKINSDGSYFTDIGSVGVGGIMRDSRGDFIMAYSIPMQCTSNNEANALAMLTERCKQNAYNKYIIKMDSQIISNMLINKGIDNLKLKHIINSTIKSFSGADVTIKHCYREANQVANFLAKLAFTSGTRSLYPSLQHLPREAKGLFQLDK